MNNENTTDSKQTLNSFLGKRIQFDEYSAGYIWAVHDDGNRQIIGEVRGWGAIQNLFKNKDGSVDFEKAEEFQDYMGRYIAEAINEKMKRE